MGYRIPKNSPETHVEARQAFCTAASVRAPYPLRLKVIRVMYRVLFARKFARIAVNITRGITPDQTSVLEEQLKSNSTTFLCVK